MANARTSDLLPPPDVEYLFAYRLLSDSNPLLRATVLELIGRPRRYADLRVATAVKSDNQLTRVLRYLQEDGIINQRIDAAQKPPVSLYELSPLGRLVLIRMLQMVPAKESAHVFLRGKAADEAVSSEF